MFDIQKLIENLTDVTDLRLDKLMAVLEDLRTDQLDMKQRVEKIAVSVSFVEAWLSAYSGEAEQRFWLNVNTWNSTHQ